MPTNRRRRMRRGDSVAEAQAWELIFKAGHDYFRELRRFGGVELDAYGRPPRDVAAEAWARLGARYMATHQLEPGRPPWAMREFGLPWVSGGR